MKTQLIEVQKIIVTDVKGMDKFSFIFENYEGIGSVTIDTTSGVFSYIWGSMGCDTVQEFISTTSNDYLAGCFLRGIIDEDERGQKFYALNIALDCIREYINE